ncbi:hypothetical protein MICA_1083 [Micavibrio aeruginosavorus ARL-13]|uniref:Uncharacterized protein n=1 Tax=Micavibrio aeruginosavorus (strain ARL-13) TaxID=856793 RepID=G2KN78_MICAA|nr:hypothetical protein MICA_1083 [Micavibrio aeruginosavorus ARL-13]
MKFVNDAHNLNFRHCPVYPGNPWAGMDYPNKSGNDGWRD